MGTIRCHDCGKRYNYDQDAFCPRCGAFNQPGKSVRIGADGAVVRTEGLNEKNHAGSFVHQEFHAENRVRKAVGLSKGARGAAAPARPAARQQGKKKNPIQPVVWIIILIIAFNILSTILGALFG